MGTVRTETLVDQSLDWAVTYCQLLRGIAQGRNDKRVLRADHEQALTAINESGVAPISELTVFDLLAKEDLAIFKINTEWCATQSNEMSTWRRDLDGDIKMAMIDERDVVKGSTPQIAIKRCYVMSVVGRSIEIPNLP